MRGEQLSDDDGRKWVEEFFGKVIPVLEARLAGHGAKFIAGGTTPTIADFKAFQCHLSSLQNQHCPGSPEIFALVQAKIDASPNYCRWVQAMTIELQSYIASRPPSPF